jgi:hypothetical protein
MCLVARRRLLSGLLSRLLACLILFRTGFRRFSLFVIAAATAHHGKNDEQQDNAAADCVA